MEGDNEIVSMGSMENLRAYELMEDDLLERAQI